MPKIGIVIPTLNGEEELKSLLPRLLSSPLKPTILVIDSSSDDDTAKVAATFGVLVEVIARDAFNHGLTREFGRKKLESDIIIYLTQDALPLEDDALERLIDPLLQKQAVVAYGRQHPRQDAPFIERFLRGFNYPEMSEIRSIKNFTDMGSAVYFCSNAFAAYDNRALDEIGGFSKVFFGEDTLAAAELLNKGGRVAYVAEAGVIHSHNFSLWEEFKRYRLMGKERALHPHYFKKGEVKRGWIFAKKILYESPLLYWPRVFIHLFVKGLGFYSSSL